ncbi:hypothetical protein [uncultured Eudoraea sp.]|uniref:hypothetical protein n=1 Tax=uncultured Eudoraea sp. TaxID=1035614 RepID=UPI0026017C67|nr:hypothetical protein [uncultured Eudoraea sp.]
MDSNRKQSLKPLESGQGKDKHKGTELKIICTLLGGVLPIYELQYQNRRITGVFCRSIWGDKNGIIKMARQVLEEANIHKPFVIV